MTNLRSTHLKIRDVVIIGDSLAGCAAALTLAKQGIGVTLVASSMCEKISPASFISKEKWQERVTQWQAKIEEALSDSRACEHLTSFELNRLPLSLDLKEQLKSFDQVEWLTHHHLVELLTLDQHSIKGGDRYRKATCFGSVVYNGDKQETEILLSKETILATEGIPSFFPCSLSPSCGMEWIIAQRAGVRVLSTSHTKIHPLALFQKSQPCLPLPLALLKEGGKLYQKEGVPLSLDPDSSTFAQDFYDALLQRGVEHAWLDLSLLDLASLREKAPFMEAYGLREGLHLAKNLFPVAPLMRPLYGGICVDRVGQTSLHRLRAIGEVACTGLVWKGGEEVFSVLESLVWAVASAEEIAKQINRLVYYFPEMRQPIWTLKGHSFTDEAELPLEEDWKLLRHTVGAYLGIKRNRERLERGEVFLEQLRRFNTPSLNRPLSIEQMQLFYAIQGAEWMMRAGAVS